MTQTSTSWRRAHRRTLLCRRNVADRHSPDRGCRFEDNTKPDGTPRKLMNSDRLKALGWTQKIPLRDGIEQTCRWFCDKIKAGALRGMNGRTVSRRDQTRAQRRTPSV